MEFSKYVFYRYIILVFFVGLYHQFNLVRESVLASRGSNLLNVTLTYAFKVHANINRVICIVPLPF
jgi:hypothetical protein